jgi:DNA polymerase type B, organellar and viral
VSVTVAPDRASHWIRENKQCRIPSRWIAFDTESKSTYKGIIETQTWRIGAAYRWRHGLRTGDHAEHAVFDTPDAMVAWIAEYCRPGHRTVCYAHNLAHDTRIAQLMMLLPKYGFRLVWCNLDRNVSAMTWRSDHGTLVFADTFTWLPTTISEIAPMVGLSKQQTPSVMAPESSWKSYCLRDAEIVYRVVSQIIRHIAEEQLGNWQPTGSGMAYTMWRHKHMTHRVLVHCDVNALEAEREAMHTGRAEAWRHGRLTHDKWVELDMRNAYLAIAARDELPAKLKFQTGAISNGQYRKLAHHYRVLGDCAIDTRDPCVPCRVGGRTLWPVGTFRTWLWDTEIEQALKADASVRIKRTYVYTRAPVLRSWALHVLRALSQDGDTADPVVRLWYKHAGRALIGRIALRVPQWTPYADNIEHYTGISYQTDGVTGVTSRLMHVGRDVLIESERQEGRDSLPQITGWIMARCRALLWEAMRAAGTANLAHVDTDSLVVSQAGLARLRASLGAALEREWQVKGAWWILEVFGPRNYRAGKRRKVSGVPGKASEIEPNTFVGEMWHGMARDLADGHAGAVLVEQARWHMKRPDPRRRDAPGAGSDTSPYEVQAGFPVSSSSSANAGIGACGTATTLNLGSGTSAPDSSRCAPASKVLTDASSPAR